MALYRVISMDGGGIRGILTARLLERIDQQAPGFLKQVDLFAGTSTGGLLALGLAGGFTPAFMRQLYQDFGKTVFPDSLIRDIDDLGNLIWAKYPVEPLKQVLEKYFKGKRLFELDKRVLIASFKLDNEGKDHDGVRTWKMKFFENYPGPGSDGDELVVDVGLRTAVAPVYFPTYQGYVDGGVAASNPAMCALAQALDRKGGNQPLNNVALFSIGTGFNPHYLPLDNANWGLVQWAPHFLDIMLDADSDMVDFQVRQVMEDHYLRLNPRLNVPINMDEVHRMPELLSAADQVDLSSAIQWIKQNFM